MIGSLYKLQMRFRLLCLLVFENLDIGMFINSINAVIIMNLPFEVLFWCILDGADNGSYFVTHDPSDPSVN